MISSSDDPSCHLCAEPVDPEQDWCFGCRAFICEECTGEGILLMGDHKPGDHQQVQ